MKIFFNEKLLWLIIISSVGGIAGYYSFHASTKIFNYIKINKKTSAEITKWEVKAVEEDKYVISAEYSYKVKGIILNGQTTFYDDKYLNVQSAIGALKEKEKQSFDVWYSPYNKKKSSLIRSFPVKNLIYSLVTIALLLYFCILKIYVVRYKNIN